MSRPRLLLFPGLGVDGRVYAPQRSLPVEIEVAEWIEPESPREPLAHYAERMAHQLGERPDCYAGGISLGAMVAMEAAAALKVRGVLVIGGCTSYRQIAPPFRGLLVTASLLPNSALPAALTMAPPALKLFEKLDDAQARLMAQMLREHSPSQLRWSCRALLRWECRATATATPVYHIHGEQDEVIPLSAGAPTELVPDGRHLINLTHAAAVNSFILKHATVDDPTT